MFEDIKEGDELLFTAPGFKEKIVFVSRITADYIYIHDKHGDIVFSRQDGYHFPREEWRNAQVSALTATKRAMLLSKAQADYLRGMAWHSLSPDTLNEFAELLHSHGFDAIPVAVVEVH